MSLRRKCWRYVPVLCTLADIKRGDLYQLQKASADDQLDESQLFLATTDAKPVPPDADPPPAFEGQTMVMCVRMVEDKSWNGGGV